MTLLKRYILPVLLFTLSALTTQAQVSANFTTDVVSGCSPLVVHFTNTTGACSSCTYSWNFGNGDPLDPSPGPVSTSYSGAGTYTATLTVTDGGVITTHSVTITVFPAPTVSFTAVPTAVCPGGSVAFTSTTLGGVPGPVTYTWAFGDGGVGTGSSPTHTYLGPPGYYTVTLFATNSDGCQSSLAMTNYIEVYTPPVASFFAATTHFCSPPGDVVFTNTSTGTPGLTYTWEFGDGSPSSTTPAPTHDYTSPGAYTVTLVVTDGHGCMDSVTHFDYIDVANLVAGFTGPDTACVNTTVTFANTSTPLPTIISSTWTFGDGSPSYTATTGTHLYRAAGTYTVTLVVWDGTCYDTITHTIVILPGPTISFSINPGQPCPPPTTLAFTGTAPPGTIITWLDGDTAATTGLTGTGFTFSHTYTLPGVYTISMIAIDPTTGCKDTVSQTITLYNLVFHASAVPNSGCVPLTVNFFTSVTSDLPDPPLLGPIPYPYGVSSYTWNFGDGSAPGSGATPTHIYTAVGVYNAVVTMITGNGCEVIDTVKIWVGTPPLATFTATPLVQCYHDNQIFLYGDTIRGPADWYSWTFYDSTALGLLPIATIGDSTDTDIYHFIVPGVYTIKYIAYYNGCPDSMTRYYYVRIDSSKSIISDLILCAPPGEVKFGDSSLGDNSREWIFGDGDTSTAPDPVHTYSLPTTFTVTLATYNAATGCRDTITKAIDLARPLPDFTADDTAICQGGFIHFTPTVTGGTASAYFWYRDGILRDNDTSAIYLDTFRVSGFYTIMLVIEDQNGCFDTITKTNFVEVAQPVPGFTAIPSTGCLPLAVTFTDHSTDITGVTFSRYIWSFGDGVTTTVTSTPAVHTFTAPGTFTTQEIIIDRLGCKDSTTLPITVYNPSAAFVVSNINPCVNTAVTFTSISTGTIASYYWIFGDGGTSTSLSPTYTYTAVGVYTVKLVVTDPHGCTDTATYIGYINANKPDASFYMTDSLSICPPLSTSFINTSTGAISYSWTLGDGTSSLLPSPSDLYITSGVYHVRLIATNIYGCADTAIGTATIFGYAGSFSYTPDSGCSPLTVHFYADISNVPTIIWDFGNGSTSTVSATDSMTYTYTLPGAFVPKLILSDNTGCESASQGTDTIKIDAVTAGFTENPNPVCLGGSFNFVDTSHSYWSSITAWSWLFDGTTNTTSAPTFTIATPGTYPATLQVTDAWGCTGTVNDDVMVYPPPVITVSPDTIICLGDAATLTGYGGVSYTWSPPATLSCISCNPSMASPTVITSYTVTGMDVHGCTNTDTTTVFLKTKTVSVAYMDTSICQGVTIHLLDSGANKFNWSPAAGLSSPTVADPLASPLETTKYTIIAQLGSCIPDTNTLIITVYPVPTVTTSPDQTVVAGTPAQLTAKGQNIATYLWDNAYILNCDTCPTTVATMSVTTHFTVTVTSAFGCTNSDSTTVFVICDKSQIFIPNAFTPNGDGQDDVFYPRGTGISVIKSFRIYNRWGELLFERTGIGLNDVANAWDGTYNGSMPKPDVYVYIIDATCETGAPVNIKGDVTIIR